MAKKTKLRKYIKKIKVENLKGDEELTQTNTKLIDQNTEITQNFNENLEEEKTQKKKIKQNNPFRKENFPTNEDSTQTQKNHFNISHEKQEFSDNSQENLENEKQQQQTKQTNPNNPFRMT